MGKLKLKTAADEFEMISNENPLFYNKLTGEFEHYIDPAYSGMDDNADKYESDEWVAAPTQFDIHEYSIMEQFAESVSNAKKSERLCNALRGKGAFRRFKDTLDHVGLLEKWYDFKHEAYIEIAREWCESEGIEYEEA